MTCRAIRGATAVRTPPTKCAGRAPFDEDAMPCAPSESSATRKREPTRRWRRAVHATRPISVDRSPTHRTPDAVEFAVSPQVGQAVLAFARSYSNSGPNAARAGRRHRLPTCEALAIEG